jgi:hypothetical protein
VERRRSFLTGWRLDAARERHAFQLANMLAAEAAQRLSLARRLALLDALQSADRPLLAAELMGRVEARLGTACWGQSPKRALHDDVRRLKAAGCVIHYRRGQPPGYRWGSWHGAVDPEAVRQRVEPADPAYIKAVAHLTPREKLERAEGMAKWAKTLHAQAQTLLGEPL